MKKFKGTLTRDDGPSHSFKVHGEFEDHTIAGDIDASHGWVKANDGRHIAVGACTLTLSDGQEISIVIGSSPFSSSTGTGAAFF